MRLIYKLLPVTAALILSSCAVGPDYQRPEVYVPHAYRTIGGEETDVQNWLDVCWWKEYGSTTLDQLVSSALANNRNLQQTMANVERAAAALTIARSDLFPQLNYSGEAARQRASENSLSGAQLQGRPYNAYQALAAASWELDLWGKIRRQTESAQATLRATEASHKAAIVSVVSSTVTTYISVLQAEEQLRIARETAQSYYQTYKLFLERYRVGNISEMEVAQAKSQWQSAKVQIPSIEQQKIELLNSLSILTGVQVDQMPKLDKLGSLKTPKIAKGIPSKLLMDRPDVVAAEEQLIAANADIGVARANYFPSISLSGGLGFSSDELSDLLKAPSKMWTLSGSITGPIFHWGAVRAGVRSAEAEEKALLAAYLLSVQQAFVDVDNSLSSRQNLLREMKDKRALVQTLREYKRLANAQYDGGYTGYVTVLQAEQSLLPQELSLAEVRASALSSVARIYSSLGGAWIDQALMEEQAAIADREAKAEAAKKAEESGKTPDQSQPPVTEKVP